METLALMDKIREWKLPVKSHMASLDASMIEEIRDRLKEDDPKKKVSKAKTVKKKAAKKKVAKKKTATTKKTAKKKTAVKKAITKKTVTKKTTKKVAAAAEPTEEKAVKKTVRKKSTVIRRKAADIEKAAQEAAAKEAADASSKDEETLVAQGVAEDFVSEPESADTNAPTEKAEKSSRVSGRNIVGKIDLETTNRSSRPAPSSGPITSGGRTMGARNIRTGFVAPTMPQPELQDQPRKLKEERVPKKKAGASAKEQPLKTFTSSDFRKREVIFQPKKKRSSLRSENKPTQITTPKASKRIVKMYEEISVNDFANELKIKTPQLIKALIKSGVMANVNTMLDVDTASLIASEFNFEVESLARSEQELIQDVAFGDLNAEPVTRPPVVTVMGHVDHGKTTLLDSIRKANVARGEAGGITQHIGAYSVKTSIGDITFLDTPGHEAFTAMRARGANVTDIAIIVVAADDGVMPQTEEAINHAKAAGVPIIVAVNKMDKEGANPEKIKQQLTEFELVPEEWGGSTIFVEVSAINGTNIDGLLEQISLLAEIQELKANPKRSGTGIVVEAKMEKGRGAVATLLIKDGTVKMGDLIVAGKVSGKIRAMTDDKGQRVNEVGPGCPVEIIGLSEAPMAGDQFDICENEASVEKLIAYREDEERKANAPSEKVSLEQLFSKMTRGEFSELPVILKGDVAGSIEAIKASFDKMKTEEVEVKVIHSAVGGISESDVLLASTSGAVIVGFNVRPDTTAQRLAKEKGIDIKCYKIIYELLDDIKKAMSGLLKPDLVEKDLGSAEVRDTFSVPKMGVIAGCFVTDGKVVRGSKVRLVREGRLIYEGVMSSLKRFKDDAKEVASGYECGIGIENYNDIKVGDIIEAYQIEEVARSLE
ncbi:MAG: translation initiation factor IF-2 [Bdellovibrionales bacterium]